MPPLPATASYKPPTPTIHRYSNWTLKHLQVVFGPLMGCLLPLSTSLAVKVKQPTHTSVQQVHSNQSLEYSQTCSNISLSPFPSTSSQWTLVLPPPEEANSKYTSTTTSTTSNISKCGLCPMYVRDQLLSPLSLFLPPPSTRIIPPILTSPSWPIPSGVSGMSEFSSRSVIATVSIVDPMAVCSVLDFCSSVMVNVRDVP